LKLKYENSNGVHGNLELEKSTSKAFVSIDPTRENIDSVDENGLVEYNIDNEMIEYQRSNREVKNVKDSKGR